MTLTVLLDSGPLGLLVHPRNRLAVEKWLIELGSAEVPVLLPLITYYEVRRELLRIRSMVSLGQLDALTRYMPLGHVTQAVLVRASELWSEARQKGRPAAPDAHLDVDMILAATALEVAATGTDVVVATTNVRHLAVRHLAEIVPARRWEQIVPTPR